MYTEYLTQYLQISENSINVCQIKEKENNKWSGYANNLMKTTEMLIFPSFENDIS